VARIIPNKQPLDLQNRKAIGFGFPFNANAVFRPTYTTRDQIKANLVNYLLTNHGERVFKPNWGSNLRTLIFENIDSNTLDDLQAIIQGDINNYFPDVSIKEINFKLEEDTNTINFLLTYNINNFGIEDDINIAIQ
jgi:uncharacterized protein|tara:strand:- start:518 stop:925 length:408 start_codon:yes stop_codon:yes gene_type:complete